MAQIRGTAGYNLGSSDRFGAGPSRNDAINDPSPLEQIREQTSKIEEWLENAAEPVKPYVCPRVHKTISPARKILGLLSLTRDCSLMSIGLIYERLNGWTDRVRPPRYVPALGRFLIVCTFIEDALRIVTQWTDQLTYLETYRHSGWPLWSKLPKPETLTCFYLSTVGHYPSLPHCQRDRNGHLLHPHHPQTVP